METALGLIPWFQGILKGVYQSHTLTPKYNHIWDVSIVLNYLSTLHPVDAITLKNQTLKLLMLLLLVTGKRGQTIHMLSLDGMTLTESYCEFQILHHTKTSKPGTENSNILIRAYNKDKKICPVATLSEYLKRTKSFRKHEQRLFTSYIQPHHKVSRDTISR